MGDRAFTAILCIGINGLCVVASHMGHLPAWAGTAAAIGVGVGIARAYDFYFSTEDTGHE